MTAMIGFSLDYQRATHARFADWRRRLIEVIGEGATGPDGPVEKRKRTRKPLTFTKRDVARAISAHMSAGLSVGSVNIDRQGIIKITTGQPESTNITPTNEWDDAL
jgi:hypothetical protein